MIMLAINNLFIHRWKRFAFRAAYCVLGICIATPAVAAPLGIAVTPSVIDVTVAPDETTKTGTIVVKNTADVARTLHLHARMFDVDETGATVLKTTEEPISVTVRLSPERFTLSPGASQTVRYDIVVPKDVPDGTVPRALVITSDCEAAPVTTATCLRARVGIPLMVTVDRGALRYAATMHAESSAWVQRSPVSQIPVSITNTGSAVFMPQITVVMRTLWGREVARAEVPPQHSILPEHTRTFTLMVPHPQAFGLYTFTATVTDTHFAPIRTTWWGIVVARTEALWGVLLLVFGISGWVAYYYTRKRT